jgi:hypothetical protein
VGFEVVPERKPAALGGTNRIDGAAAGLLVEKQAGMIRCRPSFADRHPAPDPAKACGREVDRIGPEMGGHPSDFRGADPDVTGFAPAAPAPAAVTGRRFEAEIISFLCHLFRHYPRFPPLKSSLPVRVQPEST